MSLDIKAYYLDEFRGDWQKIFSSEYARVTNSPDMLFDKHAWFDTLFMLDGEKRRACFIFSMFITLAIGQTLFTYFTPYHEAYWLHARLPRFGYRGLGPHNENPLMFIKYPLRRRFGDCVLLPIPWFEKYAPAAAQLFVDEIRDFCAEHAKEIDPGEFVYKFASDPYIEQLATEDPNLRMFVDQIKESGGMTGMPG